MKEIWKEIKNYEGYYQVSSFGRIKGLARIVINNKGYRSIPEKELKLRNHTAGYNQVLLSKKGEHKYLFVHRIVAEAFIGTIEKGCVINHKDGNKKNNIYTNLEIVSQLENIRHSISTGLNNNFGENHYISKLTNKDVLNIRTLYKDGSSLIELTSIYPVSKPTICRIVNNKIHKRVN